MLTCLQRIFQKKVAIICFYIVFVICLLHVSRMYLPSTLHSTSHDAHFSLKRSRCILVNCKKGNLANQIWEYMSLYVVWQRFRDRGYVPYIEEDMLSNLKDLFPNLTISAAVNITKSCEKKRWYFVIRNINTLAKYSRWFGTPCRNVSLEMYSARYEDIMAFKGITKEMRFHDRLIKDALRTLKELARRFGMSANNVTFVGMHYRGNDYVKYLAQNYNKTIQDLPDYNYYKRAMKYFKKKYKKLIFILISIDKEWLGRNQRQIEEGGNVVVNPYDDDKIHDLVLLSKCQHSIINYGTFGTAAAFFAGGTTFAYNLRLPLDHRGATIALGIAKIRNDWHVIS